MELEKLTQEDPGRFLEWLDLDLNAVTWEGRNKNKFDLFWNRIFQPGSDIQTLVKKLRYCQKLIRTGPVISWLDWLEKKLFCYYFVHKGASVRALSKLTGVTVSTISLTLRDFFINRFPIAIYFLDYHLHRLNHILFCNLAQYIYDQLFQEVQTIRKTKLPF